MSLLTHHAEKYAHKTAVVGIDVDTFASSSISYAELLRAVVKTANYLTTKGVARDSQIAILMQNSLEIILIELAAGLLGAATVPLDVKRDTLDRKIFKLSDTGAKVLLVKSAENIAEIDTLSRQVETITFSSAADFTKLIDGQPETPLFSPVSDTEHRYLILYTSGTTALPKGVPIKTRALIANAEGIAKWQKLSSHDRFNIILPLHHINSTTMSLATLLVGGTVVLSSRYSVSRFWQTVAREKCTITSVVPTVIHDLLIRKDEFLHDKPDVTSLTRILIGSAPVLPAETLRFYREFGIRVVQGYGQTETALRVTGVPVDLSDSEYIKTVKSNSIGMELANNNVAIFKKRGTEAKEKEEGEICIRGPILADGYWRNPQETKKSFYDGWFHSGDLGYFKYISPPVISSGTRNLAKRNKKEKYFFIKGRLKEIIIKGGINLSPALIEDSLLKVFPEIDEVSVVGYPDERMGEEIAAVIVPREGSDFKEVEDLTLKIIEAGKDGSIPGLSHYEAPKKVFIVDSLPKTSTGKIQRVEVKKMVSKKVKEDVNERLYVRRIKPDEINILKAALKINNQRWHGLPSTLSQFRARVQNGLFFGVFDQKKGLLGSVSCLQMNFSDVNKLKTWEEATAEGTLSNHNPQGDTLLCVAISVKGSTDFKHTGNGRKHSSGVERSEGDENEKWIKLHELAIQKIEEYLRIGKDHVIEFHRKPKGGLSGAEVWKILPHGRPEDKNAMGYNVLMKYPDVSPSTKIIRSHQASPSVQLIEHALFYAKEHGIRHVIAFSRPAGYRNYLAQYS